VAKWCGVPFLYRDFREGWKEGIETSKRLNMYRQQYCGCIYSEKERYFKDGAHGAKSQNANHENTKLREKHETKK
jgi:predicted adenine nucleotide alpha hydrolase (AANH) superfamily ATPase